MLAANSSTYSTIADNSYIGRAALNPFTDWEDFFQGSYDDAQVLASSGHPTECDDERRSQVGYTRVMED